MSEKPDLKFEKRREKRPVLIVVEEWPDGTMAFKLGSAMTSALGQRREEATLVQFSPERIFRVETDVSEAEFRLALNTKEVSHHGDIHFSELPSLSQKPAT
ncbi:hypothetical protein [Sphingorhabdus sp.]|jgi:hypothetical protein|uniref:hypothetical protein n=1 Tax=Sphingorhabdus sp. TaxID=1902408 RepID=UPI0037CA3861